MKEVAQLNFSSFYQTLWHQVILITFEYGMRGYTFLLSYNLSNVKQATISWKKG